MWENEVIAGVRPGGSIADLVDEFRVRFKFLVRFVQTMNQPKRCFLELITTRIRRSMSLHDYSSCPKFEDNVAKDTVAKPTKSDMAQVEKSTRSHNSTTADDVTEPSRRSVFGACNRWTTEGAILALYLIGKH